MKRSLVAILNDERLTEVTLAIDALYECLLDRTKLLNFIPDGSILSRVGWVVSGRNMRELEKSLDRMTRRCKLSLELNTEAIFQVACTYIDIQVKELADQQGYDDTRTASIQAYLDKNAHTPRVRFSR